MQDATQTDAAWHVTAKVTVSMIEWECAEWRRSAVPDRPNPFLDPAPITTEQVAVLSDRTLEAVQRWKFHPASGYPAQPTRGNVLRWLVETGRMDADLNPIPGAYATPRSTGRPRVKRWVTAHLEDQ
jgi:hypothetical protein